MISVFEFFCVDYSFFLVQIQSFFNKMIQFELKLKLASASQHLFYLYENYECKIGFVNLSRLHFILITSFKPLTISVLLLLFFTWAHQHQKKWFLFSPMIQCECAQCTAFHIVMRIKNKSISFFMVIFLFIPFIYTAHLLCESTLQTNVVLFSRVRNISFWLWTLQHQWLNVKFHWLLCHFAYA